MQQGILLLDPSSTLCVEFLSALLQYHRAEPDEPFHCCLGYFAGSKTRVGLLDLQYCAFGSREQCSVGPDSTRFGLSFFCIRSRVTLLLGADCAALPVGWMGNE